MPYVIRRPDQSYLSAAPLVNGAYVYDADLSNARLHPNRNAAETTKAGDPRLGDAVILRVIENDDGSRRLP